MRKEKIMPKYALRMLWTVKSPTELKPGDIFLGFHAEPYQEVTEEPRPGSEERPGSRHAADLWYVPVKSVDPLGIRPSSEGMAVFSADSRIRIGTVPLDRPDPRNKPSEWVTPDGTPVIIH